MSLYTEKDLENAEFPLQGFQVYLEPGVPQGKTIACIKEVCITGYCPSTKNAFYIQHDGLRVKGYPKSIWVSAEAAKNHVFFAYKNTFEVSYKFYTAECF